MNKNLVQDIQKINVKAIDLIDQIDLNLKIIQDKGIENEIEADRMIEHQENQVDFHKVVLEVIEKVKHLKNHGLIVLLKLSILKEKRIQCPTQINQIIDIKAHQL